MMASLLALLTPVPGILVGEVVVLCRVTLRGPGDTQGQVLHWADLRVLQVLRWSIEPVGEKLKTSRTTSQTSPPTTIHQQFADHTVIEL